jgi:hypothetical protein
MNYNLFCAQAFSADISVTLLLQHENGFHLLASNFYYSEYIILNKIHAAYFPAGQ